ncbi:alpha/beta hydrolase [Okeania sp. SIO2C2]|uniref:alpha/beta hydrolase n=1 Tax=Okeania sp. SIO2C2 TaxID=2607787 RepID=UPI002580C3C6|nr:alpha/beta hydrolase [Okeania sp. SIO2C2]
MQTYDQDFVNPLRRKAHMIKRFTVITIAVLTSFLLVLAIHPAIVEYYTGDSLPLWSYVPDTISPEWEAFLLKKSKTRENSAPAPDDIAEWTKRQTEKIAEAEAEADEIAADFDIEYREIEIGGVPVVEVTPSSLASEEKVAVYTHGGAYVLNSAKGTLKNMAIFANATDLKVIGIDYTLAPHSKWQQTTDEVVSVFQALLAQGYAMDDIVLYGDSAGGGLAAGSTLKMRDLGMGMPAALVLWSPWADISETGDTYVTLRDAEPYYTYEDRLGPSALAYANKEDHQRPYVSPVYGDFSAGFPPTLIQGGTKEIFLSNFVRLYQALDQAGQTVKLDIYEGMPHVFQQKLPDTKESQDALKKVSSWVNEYLLKVE